MCIRDSFSGGGGGVDKLSAVAWFKFTPHADLSPDMRCDPTADYLSVELEHLRWGRVACVKLIACDNLMDEWEDHHDAPNVDCRKFILRGVPVALDDYLAGVDDEEEGAEKMKAEVLREEAAEHC